MAARIEDQGVAWPGEFPKRLIGDDRALPVLVEHVLGVVRKLLHVLDDLLVHVPWTVPDHVLVAERIVAEEYQAPAAFVPDHLDLLPATEEFLHSHLGAKLLCLRNGHFLFHKVQHALPSTSPVTFLHGLSP